MARASNSLVDNFDQVIQESKEAEVNVDRLYLLGVKYLENRNKLDHLVWGQRLNWHLRVR